jgi:DMSO/TMAO reductase YedYZ heme-binding membrane subunit
MIPRLGAHGVALALAIGILLSGGETSVPTGLGGDGLAPTIAFGLLAVVFLYLALLVSPLYAVFPKLPGKTSVILARRALGIDAAIFSALHGWYGFTGFVGGFDGLEWWSWDYQFSLLIGAIALLILFVLAATSFDAFVRVLGSFLFCVCVLFWSTFLIGHHRH